MAVVPGILESERKLAISTDAQGRKNLSLLAEANAAAARGELTEARARELLSRMVEGVTGEGLQTQTVRNWSAEWQKRKMPLAKSTRDRYATSMRTFLAFLGDKADRSLEMITKTDIRNFRDEVRYGKGIDSDPIQKSKKKPEILMPIRTAKTTNHYLKDVRAMLKEAVEDDLLTNNPAKGVKSLPEDDSVTRKPFTSDEVKKLIEKSGEIGWYGLVFSQRADKPRLRLNRCSDWPGVILFGYYVGTRIGDIARLTWQNIDLDGEVATFVPSKTKRNLKIYQVPLHTRLVSWLKEQRRNSERDGPVFPSLFHTTTSGEHGLSLQFVAIMKHANIDRILIRPATKTRRAQYARGFHSLRHTSNSALANAKVSQEIRMKIMGHQSEDVNTGYTKFEIETMRSEINKLPPI